MKIKNVLVYPGDSDLGSEIIEALKFNKDIKLFSACQNPIKFDFPFHENHFIVPQFLKKDNINKLNKIIELNNIEFVYPAKDEFNLELVKNENDINAKIISSPLDTWLITSSRTKLDHTFNDKIPIIDINEKRSSGDVYQVSCISDRERGLLFCNGMENLKKLNRFSIESESAPQKLFKEYAQKMLKMIDLYGAWTFQIKKNDDEIFELIDITPRIDFNMDLYRFLGINFPLLSVYECDRDNFQILHNKYEIEINHTQKNKYKIKLPYSVIYIDLDDTIIIKKALNLKIYNFLNQCINKDKKIILITKHQKDLFKTFEKFNISPDIFNEIHHLRENDDKFQYVVDKDSIFIDDSYHERKRIKDVHEIPVFDLSMIDGLI